MGTGRTERTAPAGGQRHPVPEGGQRRRVTLVRNGPVLVEGPVRLVLDDGTEVDSDRFTVAICACRRSRDYPFCDTSHRKRVRET
ncbi:CDGSH iron-sulfur domain-containing protein [Saccharopolyspora sp. HNM0986]|nr:CDGSH iron-sulfur domain-containing protein [Saccharopolyspora sp. HNM0986]